MSWDSYVDTLKSYSPSEAVTEAIIVGKDGCQPWTALTKNLNLSEEEKKSITQMVTKPGKPGTITVGGEKYMVLRTVEDDDASLQIFARKKRRRINMLHDNDPDNDHHFHGRRKGFIGR